MTPFFPRWWHEPVYVEGWEEGFDEDPNDPEAPCWGRSCIADCCHHDDCFLRRRLLGLPDMRWPEGQEQPEVSEKVAEGLDWLASAEGEAATRQARAEFRSRRAQPPV